MRMALTAVFRMVIFVLQPGPSCGRPRNRCRFLTPERHRPGTPRDRGAAGYHQPPGRIIFAMAPIMGSKDHGRHQWCQALCCGSVPQRDYSLVPRHGSAADQDRSAGPVIDFAFAPRYGRFRKCQRRTVGDGEISQVAGHIGAFVGLAAWENQLTLRMPSACGSCLLAR
jgi:hypothetical protein